MGSEYVVVVGGLNVDIGGRSFRDLVPEDSNPGSVTTSLGGVGRNIAHNLRLLGLNVQLLTACGDDPNGQWAMDVCRKLGLGMDHALVVPGASTSTYLYLMAPDGEMALAVSDMEVCGKITPAYLEANRELLQKARAVVADANIPQESLRYLAENCTAPLFIDPVSTLKAEKLRPILGSIHTLKPNRLEAELLTGFSLKTRNDIARAADRLMSQGIHQVFLSLGKDGVYAARGKERLWLPIVPGEMVNTTGCGDAFMAALVWAWLEDLPLEACAKAGLAAGAITLGHPGAIHPGLSSQAVQEKIQQNDSNKGMRAL